MDNEILGKLEQSLMIQLEWIHENIIKNQIDEGPLGDIEDVKSDIHRFMLAVLDISINENSVHFLIHSNVVLDHPYEIFEDILLEVSWKFIKKVWEQVYNNHKMKDLLGIMNFYSEIMHSFGPIRFQKHFEKKKTILIWKFCRFIVTTRIKTFKKLIFNRNREERTTFLNQLKSNISKNSVKIDQFFEYDSIFVEFCKKAFNSDSDLSKHEKSEQLMKFWQSFLLAPKIIKTQSGLTKKGSTINKEYEVSSIYIQINEETFKFLNEVKSSDDKWEQFNDNKQLERLRNKVHNRELSLCQPKQREHIFAIIRINNMDKIIESIEEEEDKDIEESYDKLEDVKETRQELSKVDDKEDDNSGYDFSGSTVPEVEKSTELPRRRTFFEMFHKPNMKLSNSYDASNSYAEGKTRVTTNSPSQFSTQRNSYSQNMFK